MSGRIAATFPLPEAPSAFSADSPEKSLVNELTETLGVAPLELLDAAAVVLELAAALELELDDELPHAVTPTPATSTSAAMTGLLFSKCTVISSSSSELQPHAWPQTAERGPAAVAVT